MSRINDNEWAAEWLGLVEDDTPGYYQWNPTGASTDYVPIKDWKPDSDLNQFKLVLDKFDMWLEDFRPVTPWYHHCQGVFVDIKDAAWARPAESLKRIREAVENESS